MSSRPSPTSSPGALGLALLDALRAAGRWILDWLTELVGGPARGRVIFLFACVLALSSADTSTLGAVAGDLQPALGISNTELGLLNSVTLLVGAVAVVPLGLMVDRLSRIPVLAASIFIWSVAMFLSGAAGSYSTLLVYRLALGAVAATAGPAIASLTGDYFAPEERGRVYGFILAGELAGSAVGFLISGSVAGLLSWRFAFWLLAIGGFALAWAIWRTVPEPRRGGRSWLAPGSLELVVGGTREGEGGEETVPEREDDLAQRAAMRRGLEPFDDLVLDRDPARMSLPNAVRYVLRVRTNINLIIASALGYFFLAGLQTFAVIFVRGHYDVGQTEATGILGLLVVGAVAGVLVSGRLADLLLRRGVVDARLRVPGVAYVAAAILILPALVGTSLTPWIWFSVAGAAALSAANPPLDAARLDIMPSGLWGRAESVRTFLRSLAQAVAPLLFGAIADLVAGVTPEQAPIGNQPGGVSAGTATGLQVAFLLMLIPVAAAGVVLHRGRATYGRDVATAAVSEARIRKAKAGDDRERARH